MTSQLVKKNISEEYQKVYPKTFINSVIDKQTGKNLSEILQGFNMYFLSFTGDKATTRCSIPSSLRRRGIWINYILYDDTIITEYYDSNEIDDISWGNSSNWREGTNTLVGDLSISSNGYWVINGVETSFIARGPQGERGDKGDVGPPLRVLGELSSESELPQEGNEDGDSYLIGGYLYIWTTNDGWKNVGQIQGPKGESGTSPYLVSIFTSSGNLLIGDNVEETLYAEVWHGDSIITQELESTRFSWERKSGDTISDELWNSLHKGVGSSIVINSSDVIKKSQFICIVTIGDITVSNV